MIQILNLRHYAALAAVGAALVAGGSRAATFEETFDDGAAESRFTTGSINTPAIDYAYDYVDAGIPAAPSGGDGLGLRMASRTTDTDAAGAVAAIADGFAIPGDYTLTFDMYISYNGGAGGGAGSTETTFWGLNNTGSGILTTQFAGGTAEGYAFSATGEGGAGTDYGVYYTDAGDDGPGYPKSNATWAAEVDADGNEPDNNLNNYFDDPTTGIFGATETLGSPGKSWVEVMVMQSGDEVSTFFNGNLISTLTLAEAADGLGSLYFSYADTFTGSVPDDLPQAFVLIDNISATAVPEPASLALIGLGGAMLLIMVRRRASALPCNA